jgi:hypothetical protein
MQLVGIFLAIAQITLITPTDGKAKQPTVHIKCECSGINEVTKACTNIDGDGVSVLVWFSDAPEPNSGDEPDWDRYCFEHRKESEEAEALGCDHLRDGDVRYYRGKQIE